jgi:hypothetical protein
VAAQWLAVARQRAAHDCHRAAKLRAQHGGISPFRTLPRPMSLCRAVLSTSTPSPRHCRRL